MTSDILQNILSEEAQASEIHLEAQQTANEIVKNAETRAGDEERKAAMVSNLLVVLCGNRDAQPVVNSGSLY